MQNRSKQTPLSYGCGTPSTGVNGRGVLSSVEKGLYQHCEGHATGLIVHGARIVTREGPNATGACFPGAYEPNENIDRLHGESVWLETLRQSEPNFHAVEHERAVFRSNSACTPNCNRSGQGSASHSLNDSGSNGGRATSAVGYISPDLQGGHHGDASMLSFLNSFPIDEEVVRDPHSSFGGREVSGPESANLRFRTVTKTAYVCTYGRCNKQFSRIYDLRRHHEGIHERKANFPCGWVGCRRHIEAFPRKDKRDEHERKIHGDLSRKRSVSRGSIRESRVELGSRVACSQTSASFF